MSRSQRIIEVLPYDSGWKELFEKEAAQIKKAVKVGLVSIHHIGSTAVEGLSAKPVIDLMPEVLEIAGLDQFDEAMEGLGYVVKGEFGISGRRFYLKGLVDRTHHVHAFESGSEGLIRHLALRDYLRVHSDEAAIYGELKIKLATEFRYDNDGYCEGKYEFVQQLEQRALAWRGQSSR